jgi:Glucodextranase, domain B
MRFRIGSALVGMALAVTTATAAMAQADDGTPPPDTAVTVAVPVVDQSSDAPTLFVTVVNPIDQDIELPLETAQIQIQGVTLPGAVVSIDGNLVDTDDQGNFAAIAALDEGANEIEIVASDDQGNQTNTTIFVTRGE